MPITPLGRCYNVPNAIKIYHHRNGEVYITRGDEFYAVHVVKQTHTLNTINRVAVWMCWRRVNFLMLRVDI